MVKIEFTEEEISALVSYLDVAVKQVGINSVKNVFILLNKLESGTPVEPEKPVVKKASKD